MNTYVHALAAYDPGGDPALFAGGYFTTAGQAAVSRFARWNGADWSAIGAGLNGSVRAVADFDDGGGTALHAAGDFLTAGGVAASRVARWDEGGWSPLGSGIDGSVRALAVHDDGAGAALHAGGTFTTAGGVPANHVARWDGSGWAPLGSGLEGAVFSETAAHALTTFDDGSGPALVVGGQFLLAGGVAANHIARWDGLGWSALGSGMSPTGEVRSLVVFDDGNGPALYVGGVFLSAGGLSAKGLARWDGASWSDVGGGVEQVLFGNPEVNALAVFDDGNGPALYAAGNFSSAGGVSANHVARWDGTSWSPLLAGTDGRINALVVFDDGGGPALFAGGEFFTAGGVASNRLARWTGSNWSPLAGGATDDVLTLGVSRVGHQDCLVAGGSFGSVPDWEDSYLALWGRPLPCLRRAKVRWQ